MKVRKGIFHQCIYLDRISKICYWYIFLIFQESNRHCSICWLHSSSYCWKVPTYLLSCGWCGFVHCCNQRNTSCWWTFGSYIPGKNSSNFTKFHPYFTHFWILHFKSQIINPDSWFDINFRTLIRNFRPRVPLSIFDALPRN